MRTDKFIRVCLDRRKTLSTRRNISYYGVNRGTYLTWADYYLLADLTKFVDYNCKFTELGCKQYKITKKAKKKSLEILARGGNMRSGESFSYAIMCCCGSCRGSVGHSEYFPSDLKDLKIIARYFNEQTGFWRAEKGCILPRKYRSATCLKYDCRKIRPHKSGRVLLSYLNKSSEHIRKQHHKRTGENYVAIWQIVDSLKREMKKELKNENRTNSKQT